MCGKLQKLNPNNDTMWSLYGGTTPLHHTWSFLSTPRSFFFFFRLELEEPSAGQQMVFEKRRDRGVWWWRRGGGGVKEIKGKSAECVLSEASAQLN